MAKTKNKLEQVWRGMVYILPAVLFFSYWPLMKLGGNESMNFELSLPLIWLVIFDVVTVWLMGRKKMLLRGWRKKWMWLLLPVWLTLSVLWSLNSLRGILTVGILWLLYLAGDGLWSLRGLFGETRFKENFWKVFWGSSLVICGWCWLQCVLDLCGAPREVSLMCAGCTYGSFGFPHPNGFAIEPQFMGNLLLAPAIISGFLVLKNKKYLWLFFALAATLFLTFSRGAIYAFLVATLVMTIWQIIQTKKWRVLLMWPVVVLGFLFTLNAQGVMAQVSRTDDTYLTGVAKVINHLSLGVIDLQVNDGGDVGATDGEAGGVIDDEAETAMFDGYVEESTDTRLRLSGAAFEVWHQDFATALVGVGLGGAGQALYVNGLSTAPKEIVQNQYASLLLESGVVGILLLLMTLGLVVRAVWKSPLRMVLAALIVAYMVSLCFFSGLPNALHIYLIPMAIYAIGLRKKLVS